MKWSRSALKSRAKEVIKKHYLKFLVASLVIMLAGASGGINFHSNFNRNHGRSATSFHSDRGYSKNRGDVEIRIDENDRHFDSDRDIRVEIKEKKAEIEKSIQERSMFSDRSNSYRIKRIIGFAGMLIGGIVGTLIIGALILAVTFLLRIFLLFPLEVGGRKVFVKSVDKEIPPELGLIKTPFTEGFYANMVRTGFLVNFKIFLGFLKFIIPGIKRKYEYYFVPYILADNPAIESNRALEISKRMTFGHKFNIFKLEVSFIGWYFVGSLLAGIGTILVFPYQNATQAQLYSVLKEDAINNGIASAAEFGAVVTDLDAYEQFNQ